MRLHTKKDLEDLIEEERKLDELIQSCTQQVCQMCEDRQSQRYPLSGNQVSFSSVLGLAGQMLLGNSGLCKAKHVSRFTCTICTFSLFNRNMAHRHC